MKKYHLREVLHMKRPKYFKPFGLIVLMLILSAWGVLIAAPDGEKKPEEKTSPEAAMEKNPNPQVAKLDGKILTMDEFVKGVTVRGDFRLRGSSPEQLRKMKKENLEEIVKDYLFNEKLAKMAMEQGVAEDAKVKDQINKWREQSLATVIYQKEVVQKCPSPSPEEVKQYYEDNKGKYFQPFTFSMRHIFLSTLKPYTAKEGDTLESIAKEISGDENMVELILADDNQYKDYRYVKPGERAEKPFRPLQPGEKLLVPMTKEETDAVLSRAKKIQEEANSGVDFSLLAKKYSEGEKNAGEMKTITPSTEPRLISPQILEAVKKLSVGKVSDIIHSNRGLNIIRLEDKKEEGDTPLDKVKDNISRRLHVAQVKRRENVSLYEFANYTPGIAMNEEIFTAETRTSDSLVIAIDTKTSFTLADFNNTIPSSYRATFKTNRERFILVLNSQKILMPLLIKYGQYKKIDESAEFQDFFNNRKIQILAEAMRKKIIGDQPKPSEDEMKEYYEKNKITKYTNNKQYDISLIGLKIGEPGQKQDPKEREERIAKNKKRLGEILPSLKTKQDFEKTAVEMSEDPTGPHKGAVGLIPATYHNGFDGRLEKMKVDDVSEPFEFGNFVYLLRVNNIKPEEVRSFEDCKRQIENDLMNEHQRTVLSAKKEGILKAGEYEFLMKD